jgi:hypothetical protein
LPSPSSFVLFTSLRWRLLHEEGRGKQIRGENLRGEEEGQKGRKGEYKR